MLQNAIRLWKNRKEYKSSTLQGRLILFFALVICSALLLFTLLLVIFGITGSGRKTVHKYLEGELTYISSAVESDFDNLSATGIRLSEVLSTQGDTFFENHNVSPKTLSADQNAIEDLLAMQMPTLLSVAQANSCGGVFVILNDSIQGRYSGLFLKKTQPISSASIEAKTYCLRGPASVARRYSVELLGQWQMKYQESELEFFHSVMDTANANPDLPLSRLYYWTDRICLNGNSEKGLLLCVPLRSEDGTVFGICGIEVSDRMFKMLYSPNESEYQGVFSVIAPRREDILHAERGLIAGNSYLTDKQMTGELAFSGEEKGFPCFKSDTSTYGGLTKNIRIYPGNSPYQNEQWAVVTLMPKALLEEAVLGNSGYLFIIVGVLILASIAASVIVSKKYLQPIKKGLSSIREKQHYENDAAPFGIAEIDSLFEDLAQSVREHRAELNRLEREKQDAMDEHQRAQTKIERLTDKRKQEINPEEFARFMENLKTLTPTERQIFELYLAGKTTDEVLEIQQFKINTLKYHNRNIFGKLGVASRKQLLTYATIMQQGDEIKA